MFKYSIKFALSAMLLCGAFAAFSQNIAINLAGNSGNASAILDLSDASNANLGFLLPSVNLATATLSPVAGLIVYNNNATYSFGKGFYYWSGSAWLNLTNSGTAIYVTLSSGTKGAILSNSAANTPAWNLAPASTGLVLLSNTAGVPTWGADPAIATSWEITGNGNITDGTNFIGTTNTSPINFQINGTKAGRIDYNGGNGNTFLGYAAGAATPTGVQTNSEYNAGIGDFALNALTTGTRNIAIGSHALYVANNASYNTAVGRYALGATTTGSYNVAVGPNSLYNNTTGSYNTVIGTGSSSGAAADNNITGSSNAVYGYAAFQANTAGDMNVAIGDSALNSNTGSRNTALGFQSGLSVTTYSNTTSIGNGATATASNMMAFGNSAVSLVQFNGTASGAFEFNGALMPYNATASAYQTGTIGQVLTSQGASAAPQWTTISSGGLTGATGGLNTSGTNAILGGALGTPSNLNRNSEIGMNGNTLTFSVSNPNTNTTAIGIDLATNTAPAQALEIGGTANTIRIDGLQSGNTYNAVPTNNNTYLMYSNSNGDLYSIPAGTTNYVLTQTSSGPQWQPGGGGSISGAAGSVFYGTGSSYGTTSVGSSGNVLISNGASAPTWGTPTTSVISANNGLSMSGANVQFGGNPLLVPTSIDQATNSLSIGDGPLNLNTTGSSTTTLGNSTNTLTENGNVAINASNSAATTNIGTGSTSGAIAIGGGSGNPAVTMNNGGTGKVVIGNSTGFTGINQTTPKSTLDNNGSFGTAVVSATTSYTLDATSNTMLATAGTYTITLPSVSSVTGRLYNIVYNGTSNNGIIAIQGNGTDNIVSNGTSSNTFYIAGGSVTLQSNGTNWYVVALQPSVYSNIVYPVTTNAYTYASGTDFSTSSTSLAQVTGSSLTLCPGTYQINASADFSNNGTSAFSQIALVNTTSALNYGNIYDYQHTASVYSPWSVGITVTLTATTTYQIKCAAITSGSAYCRNARINALRVQ